MNKVYIVALHSQDEYGNDYIVKNLKVFKHEIDAINYQNKLKEENSFDYRNLSIYVVDVE